MSDGKAKLDLAAQDEEVMRHIEAVMAITRELFLKKRKPRIKKVPLDEESFGKGACLYVRSMTGTARSEYEKRWAGRKASKDPGAFRWDMMVRTVCNEKGELIFTDADGPAVFEQDSGPNEDLFEAGCILNGLRDKDIAELAENSEAAQ